MEQVKWKDGTMRNRRTESHVLKVHNSLFTFGEKDVKMEKQMEVFETCLRIAGGYNNKTVIIGLDADNTTCASIVVNDKPTEIAVTNPMFVPQSDLTDLLGEEDIPSDSIFPSNEYRLKFTNLSELEKLCFTEAALRVS